MTGATLLITRGLPASGKTTFAKQWVAEEPESRARCNRDDLRSMIYGDPPVFDYAREQVVTAAQHAAVRALLKRGVSVVADDTNLRLKYARAWADLAHEMGAEFEVAEFRTDAAECVRRDAERIARGERGVGEDVIRDMAARFGAHRPPVTRTEKAQPSAPAYVPDLNLPKAVIVDIDGTVAHNDGHRSFYDYTKVGADTPVEAVIHCVEALNEAGFCIVFLSGREDSCQEETLAWLSRHVSGGDVLVMRKTGDHRNDAIVKIEMFYEHVAPLYNVRFVLDDRDRVVEAWRSIGLPCFQVRPGAF